MGLAVWLAEAAERDIDDIYRYIAERDGTANADRVLRRIEQVCSSLATFPWRGNVPKELRALGITKYREAHFKPYRIVYCVVEPGVIIYSVIDGRRDIQSHLLRRLVL